MALTIPDPNNDGAEITVYTEEEKAEIEKAVADKDAIIAQKEAELETARKFQAEQAQNFKRLRDMTDDEKSKLSASEIESRTRAEKLEADIESLKGSIDSDKQKAFNDAKEAALKKFSGGDKALREKIEQNMGVLTIADPTELVRSAAAIAGVVVNNGGVNPLYVPLDGDAPQTKQANEKKEFLESDKAAAAMAAMGDAPKKA